MISFIGFTSQSLGAIMIAYTAIRVHSRVAREKKVDAHAFKDMNQERMIGFLGVALIIIGYILQIPSYIN